MCTERRMMFGDEADNAVLGSSNMASRVQGACQCSPGSPVKCNFEELSQLFILGFFLYHPFKSL